MLGQDLRTRLCGTLRLTATSGMCETQRVSQRVVVGVYMDELRDKCACARGRMVRGPEVSMWGA